MAARTLFATLLLVPLLAGAVAACTRGSTGEGPDRAVREVSEAWRRENARTLAAYGVRRFEGPPAEVFARAREALAEIGFAIQEEQAGAGVVVGRTAPRRLFSEPEWRTIEAADAPGMRGIAKRFAGADADRWRIERERDVVAVLTVRGDGAGGSAVDVAYRMDDRWPADRARQVTLEPAPTAVRMGLSKLWSAMARRAESAGAPAVAPPPPAALPERRLALVVGNAGYGGGLAALANAASDARLMARALAAVGFEVDLLIDADQRAMRRAVRDFGRRLEREGPDAVGLFYYAGHGVQVRGENYLLPVDAEVRREGDVVVEGVPADDVLRQMDPARTGVNIVILDACRDSPVPGAVRSAARGLARMEGPRGTLIAYATAPGAVAADGPPGGNSPYTLALASTLPVPGLAAEEVFRAVRQQVLAVTGEAQIPWESSSLTRAFYFAPRAAAGAEAAAGR